MLPRGLCGAGLREEAGGRAVQDADVPLHHHQRGRPQEVRDLARLQGARPLRQRRQLHRPQVTLCAIQSTGVYTIEAAADSYILKGYSARKFNRH